MTLQKSSFPGGTSVTLLDVYDDESPDGIRGGSPHMHLASPECYVAIKGKGAIQTITLNGFQETELLPGSVVWFTPGTIHRAVYGEDLQLVILMGNAGLPEAGDAVMTFPPDVVADPEKYTKAMTLPKRQSEAERAEDARIRRDLAVVGFNQIKAGILAGDTQPLIDFYAAAAKLVQGHTDLWANTVLQGPLSQAQQTVDMIHALSKGDHQHLNEAIVFEAPQSPGERRFGMCGRLRTYDVVNATNISTR